jgi:hypothetical protein
MLLAREWQAELILSDRRTTADVATGFIEFFLRSVAFSVPARKPDQPS